MVHFKNIFHRQKMLKHKETFTHTVQRSTKTYSTLSISLCWGSHIHLLAKLWENFLLKNFFIMTRSKFGSGDFLLTLAVKALALIIWTVFIPWCHCENFLFHSRSDELLVHRSIWLFLGEEIILGEEMQH